MSYKIIANINPPITNAFFVFDTCETDSDPVAEVIPFVTIGCFDFLRVSEDSLLISPATILGNYIRQELLMSDPGDRSDWPLYISYFPDVKTEMGAIYDTTGIKLGRHMTGDVIREYGIQIKISSDVLNDGWAKIEAIAIELDSIKGEEITINCEDYIIRFVSRSGPPIYLGVEDGTKKRKLFVLNCLINLYRV